MCICSSICVEKVCTFGGVCIFENTRVSHHAHARHAKCVFCIFSKIHAVQHTYLFWCVEKDTPAKNTHSSQKCPHLSPCLHQTRSVCILCTFWKNTRVSRPVETRRKRCVLLQKWVSILVSIFSRKRVYYFDKSVYSVCMFEFWAFWCLFSSHHSQTKRSKKYTRVCILGVYFLMFKRYTRVAPRRHQAQKVCIIRCLF